MLPRSLAGASRPQRRFAALPMAAALATAAFASHALQVLDAKDGVAVEAIVSLKEPTRIRIEGAPIVDVIGNVYLNNCAGPSTPSLGVPVGAPAAPQVNPAGEFVLECDRDKGEVYLRPVGDSGKPINVFVSSATATYTLLLRRADIPADTILIRGQTERVRTTASSNQGPRGPSPSHIRALKNLLVTMATDSTPNDMRVEELGHPIQLWTGTRFTLIRRYEGRGLVGELYLLQNTGMAPVVLAEQEFDREDGRVAAVAVEHHNLRPGESTSVFVLRFGGTP